MIAKVKYQIATYSGTVEVNFDDPNLDDEVIIARAKAQLRRRAGACPFGCEAFKVVERS